MRRRTRIGLTITAAVAVLTTIVALLHQSGSRSELARYKAALRAKGEKLTLVELAVLPSTNADEVESRAAFTNNPLPPVGSFVLSSMMEFIGPGKARVAWRGNLHWDIQYFNKPKRVIFGDWAGYGRTNALIAPSIEKIRDALAHPPPDEGIVYADNWQTITNIPRTFIRQRAIAQGLVHVMIAELHQGHSDAAFADLFALAAMARMDRNELTLVHHMIRVAVARLGLPATWEALQAPGWDERRLKLLQEQWEQVDLIDGVERGFRGNRAFGAILFQEVRRRNGARFWDLFNSFKGPWGSGGTNGNYWIGFWKNDVVVTAYKMTSANADELLRFRWDSDGVNLIQMVKNNRPWPEVGMASSNLIKKMDETIGKDRLHRFLVTAISAPNWSRAMETVVQGETEKRLAIAAIAIKRYELKHGKAPENLACLTPDFLKAVPIDPMSGKRLCYRLNPDGTYVLYSTGMDGKDDGGKGGMDMWKGPDAVWPSVATAEQDEAAEQAALKN